MSADTPYFVTDPESCNFVRKLYNLDKPERLDEAINLIQEWAKKQEHFTVKTFDRDYLEKLLLANKGQVERTKVKLDKLCTIRTAIPDLFGSFVPNRDFQGVLEAVTEVFLPELTPDYYRTLLSKYSGDKLTGNFYLNLFRSSVYSLEYAMHCDYNQGIIAIFDYTEVNMREMLTQFSLFEGRNYLATLMESLGIRMKEIHVLSNSKLVEVMLGMIKPFFKNAKIFNRIKLHPNLDSLYKDYPKDLLPAEYGGKQKPLKELSKHWFNVLSSKEFQDHMNKINEAKTDEKIRPIEKFNEQYLGMPGSFRTMTVD